MSLPAPAPAAPTPPPIPLPAPPKIEKSYSNMNGRKDTTGPEKFQNGSESETPTTSNFKVALAKPLGLDNLGNTCFMNAALQCLSRTKLLIPKLDLFGSGKNISVLVSLVDDRAHISVQNPSELMENTTESEILQNGQEGELDLTKPFTINLDISSESMTARLKHAFKAITRHPDVQNDDGFKNGGSYYGYRPYDIHNMISKNFRPGGQHDSHELLRTVVDMMKKDQTKAFRAGIMKKFSVAKGGKGSDPKMVELVKSLDQKTKHQTFVDEIFGGELMTTQTCLTCNSIRRSHEDFLDLSLPIRVTKPNQNQTVRPMSVLSPNFSDWSENDNIVINRTVEECLNSFTEPELLTGSNLVECENCHRINLAKLQNGATMEEVFPDFKPPPSSSSSNTDGAETSGSNKEDQTKRKEERKKRRPLRQIRHKNQISRQEQDSSGKDSGMTDPIPDISTPSSSISIIENHFTSKEPSEADGSKSTVDDFVHLSHADLDMDPFYSTGESAEKRRTLTNDCDMEYCDEIEIPALVSDTEGDTGVGGACQESLSDMVMPILKCDDDDDIEDDSDMPPALDGIGGSASDGEETNDVPPLDLDLPAYDKFNFYHVPRVVEAARTSTMDADVDVDIETTAADEGYSEGSGGSACATGGRTAQAPLTQSLSQGSSSRNSISDPDESSKGGSGSDEKTLSKKEPPVTRCPCSRQHSISRPPEFLTIHLKRFQISNRGYTSKLSDHIEFPLLLDLTKFCSVVSEESKNEIFDEDGQVMYNLYGIVEHSGSLHWGHYVAYIRHKALGQEDEKGGGEGGSEFVKNDWYYISDSHVSACTEESISYRDPYILFYERIRGETKKARQNFLAKRQEERERDRPPVSSSYFPTNSNGWSSNYKSSSTATTAAADSTFNQWGGNWDDDQLDQPMTGCMVGPLTEADAAGLTNMIDDDGDQETITEAAENNTTCAIPLPPPEEEENWEPETEANLAQRGQCTGWNSNPYWYDNDTSSTQPMVPASNNTSFTIWESPKAQDRPRASAAWEGLQSMANLIPPTRPQNSEGEEPKGGNDSICTELSKEVAQRSARREESATIEHDYPNNS